MAMAHPPSGIVLMITDSRPKNIGVTSPNGRKLSVSGARLHHVSRLFLTWKLHVSIKECLHMILDPGGPVNSNYLMLDSNSLTKFNANLPKIVIDVDASVRACSELILDCGVNDIMNHVVKKVASVKMEDPVFSQLVEVAIQGVLSESDLQTVIDHCKSDGVRLTIITPGLIANDTNSPTSRDFRTNETTAKVNAIIGQWHKSIMNFTQSWCRVIQNSVPPQNGSTSTSGLHYSRKGVGLLLSFLSNSVPELEFESSCQYSRFQAGPLLNYFDGTKNFTTEREKVDQLLRFMKEKTSEATPWRPVIDRVPLQKVQQSVALEAAPVEQEGGRTKQSSAAAETSALNVAPIERSRKNPDANKDRNGIPTNAVGRKLIVTKAKTEVEVTPYWFVGAMVHSVTRAKGKLGETLYHAFVETMEWSEGVPDITDFQFAVAFVIVSSPQILNAFKQASCYGPDKLSFGTFQSRDFLAPPKEETNVKWHEYARMSVKKFFEGMSWYPFAAFLVKVVATIFEQNIPFVELVGHKVFCELVTPYKGVDCQRELCRGGKQSYPCSAKATYKLMLFETTFSSIRAIYPPEDLVMQRYSTEATKSAKPVSETVGGRLRSGGPLQIGSSPESTVVSTAAVDHSSKDVSNMPARKVLVSASEKKMTHAVQSVRDYSPNGRGTFKTVTTPSSGGQPSGGQPSGSSTQSTVVSPGAMYQPPTGSSSKRAKDLSRAEATLVVKLLGKQCTLNSTVRTEGGASASDPPGVLAPASSMGSANNAASLSLAGEGQAGIIQHASSSQDNRGKRKHSPSCYSDDSTATADALFEGDENIKLRGADLSIRKLRNQVSRSADEKHRLRVKSSRADAVYNKSGVKLCDAHAECHRLVCLLQEDANTNKQEAKYQAVNDAARLQSQSQVGCIQCLRYAAADLLVAGDPFSDQQWLALRSPQNVDPNPEDTGRVWNALHKGLERTKLFNKFKDAADACAIDIDGKFELQLREDVTCRFKLNVRTAVLRYKKLLKSPSTTEHQWRKLRQRGEVGFLKERLSYMLVRWLLGQPEDCYRPSGVELLEKFSDMEMKNASPKHLFNTLMSDFSGEIGLQWTKQFLRDVVGCDADEYLSNL